MIDFEQTWTRVLVVLALGLAASSGVSVVLEALAMPPWIVKWGVLAAFAGTLGLAVTTAVHKRSAEVKREEVHPGT